MDMEKEILEQTGWSERHLPFYGTLVYAVVDSNHHGVADIVSRRQPGKLSIEWFCANEEGEKTQKFSLVFNTDTSEINLHKTQPALRTQGDVQAFLKTVAQTIQGCKAQFFPSAARQKKHQWMCD